MRFTIPKESILEELQLLQGIVEKRNTMPILANILMNVTENEVELTGTDLEVGLKTHFAADIDKPGAVTVNGKKIFEIVKSLADGRERRFRDEGRSARDPGRRERVQGALPAERGLSPGPGAEIREGHQASPGGFQGHDRPGLLRHHPGAEILSQRGPDVAQGARRWSSSARTGTGCPIRLQAGRRPEDGQGPERHRGQEDAQRDSGSSTTRRSNSTSTTTTCSSGSTTGP